MSKQQTTKKVKYVGTQQYINADTGELVDMAVTSIEERDFNFTKVWMRNFISTLDIVGNQKTRLAFWIIDNLDKENKLCYTYRQIADKTGMSLDTVRITMKLLQDADFLRKHNSGTYVVNPDIVYKGTRNGRLNVLNQYQDIENSETAMSDEVRLRNLQKTVGQLQKTIDTLSARINSQKNQLDGQMEMDEFVRVPVPKPTSRRAVNE